MELVVVMAILATATSMFAGTVSAVLAERAVVRESVIAAEGVENFVERLRSEDIRAVWARYNADPSDDPGGPGTGPGSRFTIPGLDPGDAPDGLVAEVRFPDQWAEVVVTDGATAGTETIAPAPETTQQTKQTKQKNVVAEPVEVVEPTPAPTGEQGGEPVGTQQVLQLREDLVDARLGTPRDLSGDSIIDDLNHGRDYLLLPLEVVVRWRGRSGDHELRRFAMLCELKW